MKAVVTGVLVVMFALAGCSTPSTETSDQDLALEYAIDACDQIARADDGIVRIGQSGEEQAGLPMWEAFATGVSRARTPANKAEALDARWSGLARSTSELSIALGGFTRSWEASGSYKEFSQVLDEATRIRMLNALDTSNAECTRVNDVFALTQEMNSSANTSTSIDGASANREVEAILTAVAGIISIALFVALLWFVWWMAGRKKGNQTLYIILAIFFPLIMIIAVLLQKKLPDPESAAEQDASVTNLGPSPSDSIAGEES